MWELCNFDADLSRPLRITNRGVIGLHNEHMKIVKDTTEDRQTQDKHLFSEFSIPLRS